MPCATVNILKDFAITLLTTSAKISLASIKKTKSTTINTILKFVYKNKIEQKNGINRTALNEAAYALLVNEKNS